ncbi:S-layer family protein, partial [Pseudanabaenaceae cyanobacterium LEGE 13415]|nr:S-layer family protein [Pseudanabaenaceae cyanobacterium LEGE 13415]
NVTIQASDFIEMSGLSPRTRLHNNIGTQTTLDPRAPARIGNAGDVTISTRRLSMRDASYISGLSFSNGTGGNITVNADTLDMSGGVVGAIWGTYGTAISSVAYNSGNAGNITVNTRSGSLRDGAIISTTSLNRGNAGNVTVNATESFTLSGFFTAAGLPTNISSTKGVPATSSLRRQDYYQAIGNAGSVTINTDNLTIENGAAATVTNYGIGDAGVLKVNAGSVLLRDRASLEAKTAQGEGGNIVVNAENLRLLQNSFIATDANTIGNGGNITINAPIILGTNNSDINANATGGRGGNIEITTQGIIGLAFRDTLTPRLNNTSDITASSGIGIKGNVQVNNVGVDPNSGLVELSETFNDESQQVAAGCMPNQTSRFVITGRGGIPQSPNDRTDAIRAWSDVRPLSIRSST